MVRVVRACVKILRAAQSFVVTVEAQFMNASRVREQGAGT